MTPAARYAAGQTVLDAIEDGQAAEQALLGWARSNRYAGSKDRAAVRDIVFSCLRSWRSYQHATGLPGAKGAIVGHVLAQGLDVADVFSGQGYAPAPLTDEELAMLATAKAPPSKAVEYDLPDWLWPMAEHIAHENLVALKDRAPIDLRVNLQKTTVTDAQKLLSNEGVETTPILQCKAGLRVQGHTRKVLNTSAYLDGYVELQDAGSQQLIDMLPMLAGTVLDYCAGGGGKSLALASVQPDVNIVAYDINTKRLTDLPARAERAGMAITILDTDPAEQSQKFNHVLVDAPCSGSGAWRRSPAGKWRLTSDDLDATIETQLSILNRVKTLVTDGGNLVYMTCSIFRSENEDQVERFLAQNTDWRCSLTETILVSDQSDGFFCAILNKSAL